MKGLLTLIFFTITSITIAQDYHHWSEHFGARASLLGGAATAGLGDNATTYYNPAAMAFVENPSMSISVNAYRMRFMKIQNGLGEGFDMKESSFSTMPNLIAGILAVKKHPKIRFGYSVLTRRSFNSKFDYLYERDDEILPQFAGEERWLYAYNFQHQLMEYWAGISLSWQVSKSFSLGLAHHGIYRDVKYANSGGITILPQDFSGQEIYELRNTTSFSYYNIKGVFKPSIALSVENFKLGIAYTTPSFNMFGKAKAYREISYINWKDIIPDEFQYDVQIIDRIEGIKVRHKEYGSLAFGVSFRMGKKAWFHFTNETYFGGKEYFIFDANEAPNVYPDAVPSDTLERDYLGGQNFISLTEETEARTNIGIGLEAKIAKRWDMYMGARTDFLYYEHPNQREQDQTMYVASSRWHLYHFSLGFVYLTKKNKRYTVGLEYGMAGLNVLSNIGDTYSNSFKVLLEIEVGRNKNQ